MRILHIADIHIKAVEYGRDILDQLYKFISKEGVDTVVVAGDIFHDKTIAYGRQIDQVIKFISELCARCSHVIIIPGGHDTDLEMSHCWMQSLKLLRVD